MFVHESVLKSEAIAGLDIKPHGTYVDCTVGGGGHAFEIASRLNNQGRLIAFDQDIDALKAAQEKLAPFEKKVTFINENFRHLETALLDRRIDQVDGILFDLGVSSPQLDRGDRGFSYHQEAKLDMRMNQSQTLTAFEIVNTWSYNQLVSIFFKYGEEKFSKQIARKIEHHRQQKDITTTQDLVDIIKEAIPAPARRKGGHPAKRIFQALRITVNDELQVFSDALLQAARVTGMNGRIVVITFHSLEDRICKQAFKAWSKPKPLPRNFPVVPEGYEAPFQLVTKKPISASDEELTNNRRARSAKLRIVEKKLEWDETFNNVGRWRQ